MIGIYKITNPIDLVYIGKSIDIHKRYLTHRVCSKAESKLKMSFDLYGFENHKFEIIYECSDINLLDYEAFFINKYNSVEKGLNSAIPRAVFLNMIDEPIEVSIIYYVKTMIEDKTRGAGAPKKFPNIETTKLRIDRVVPKEQHDEMKEQVNKFINNLQTTALQNSANEALKMRKHE